MQNDQQQSFQERIKRIEAKKRQYEEELPPELKRARGQSNPMARLLVVGVVFLALVGLSVPLLMSQFPDRFASPTETATLSGDTASNGASGQLDPGSVSIMSLLGLGGTGTEGAEAAEEVPLFRETGIGRAYERLAVLTSDTEGLKVDDIAAHFQLTTGSSVPSELGTFQTNASCMLERPSSRAKIVSVILDKPGMPTPVRFPENAEDPDSSLVEAGVVDVFLTDTTAPLYVVLQDAGDGTIWNLQLAEGVRLDHVALVFDNEGGILGLPARASFEAVRGRDFAHAAAAGDVDCRPRPAREPEGDWNAPRAGLIGGHAGGYDDYSAWFERQLGVPASENRISAVEASHVLIGPRPETRIAYRPFDRQEVLFSRSDATIASSEEGVDAAINSVEQAEAAVGDAPVRPMKIDLPTSN